MLGWADQGTAFSAQDSAPPPRSAASSAGRRGGGGMVCEPGKRVAVNGRPGGRYSFGHFFADKDNRNEIEALPPMPELFQVVLCSISISGAACLSLLVCRWMDRKRFLREYREKLTIFGVSPCFLVIFMALCVPVLLIVMLTK